MSQGGESEGKMKVILLVFAMASGQPQFLKDATEMPSIEACMAEATEILLRNQGDVSNGRPLMGVGCYVEYQRDARAK